MKWQVWINWTEDKIAPIEKYNYSLFFFFSLSVLLFCNLSTILSVNEVYETILFSFRKKLEEAKAMQSTYKRRERSS